MGVSKPGHHLVKSVERCPNAVQAEGMCPNVTPGDFCFENGLPVRDGTQVTVAVGFLDGLELVNDECDSAQKALVTGCGV